jgi:hypothetical protein
MNDCLYEVPMVPKRTGRLEASHSIFVNGRLVDTSQKGNMIGTPLTSLPGPPPTDRLEGVLFANTPYALYAHEAYNQYGPFKKFSEAPNRGGKWIQTKMTRHQSKYYGIIGNAIRRAK